MGKNDMGNEWCPDRPQTPEEERAMLSQARVGAAVPAKDLERARKFYEETLGIKPSDKQTDPGGVLYETVGGAFYVYETQASGGDATRMSFVVTDFDAEMADLKTRGIKFEDYDFPGLKTVNGVAEFGGMKGAWFKDSEGNILALTTM
jgi:predicted enzyme related to lactoylglutathione lyase